jgi:hypothetical protein
MPPVALMAGVGAYRLLAWLPGSNDRFQSAQGQELGGVRVFPTGHLGVLRSVDRTVHTRLQSPSS